MQRRIGSIEYELTYKKVKNLNLRVRPDGSVTVSAPRRVSIQTVDAFVERQLPLILRARQRQAALPPYLTPPEQLSPGGSLWLLGREFPLCAGTEKHLSLGSGQVFLPPDPAPLPYSHRKVTAFLTEQLRPEVEDLLRLHLPHFASQAVTPPGGISYRNMRSRYGSCNIRTGQITFSTRLVHLPREAAEYVVVHELAHLIVPNHSAAFYQAVAEALPDYRRRLALFRPNSEDGQTGAGGPDETL
ncbi:MAG: M48 family metallopeptidase [Clostridiales bacterium]|nr:M48 family metallopeptidase [Clostridiales bacterium]